MSRIINLESAGKERARLVRCVLVAIRALGQQTDVNEMTRDLVAYISLSLLEINDLIDGSVTAWEKRGYWLKADRFRMEWIWSADTGRKLADSLGREDWATIAGLIAKTAEKFKDTKVPINHKCGTPWEGTWKAGVWKTST